MAYITHTPTHTYPPDNHHSSDEMMSTGGEGREDHEISIKTTVLTTEEAAEASERT